MTLKNSISALAFGLIIAGCQSPAAQSQTADMADVKAEKGKPNIVFIFTDDMGYHDLSLTGSEIYQTPAIDRLARESLQFTQAYSSYPRCTPSRYGLLTATYPINENKGNLSAIPAESNPIRQFEAADYQTYFVGKWHLGTGANTPTGYGFDQSFAAGATGGAHSRFYPFNRSGAPKTGDKSPIPDVEDFAKSGDYLSDILTTQTLNYIDEAKDKAEPFMVMLSYYSVHTPLEAKKEDIRRNAAEIKGHDFGSAPDYIREGEGRRKMRQDSPEYAGMVENIDENVDRILKALEDQGLADNTIVVFSSDHGGLSNDGNGRERQLATTNIPLKAGKGHLYEGGIRVPLFVRWPAAIKPAVENDSVVLGMDVFPTLLDLATDKTLVSVDGESFEPVIKGQEKWNDRSVFWHSRKARPYSTGDRPASVIRKGDYKLIDFFADNRVELYNLKSDISEQSDLSEKESAKVNEMMTELKAWRKSKNAKPKAQINQKKADSAQKRKENRKKRKKNK